MLKKIFLGILLSMFVYCCPALAGDHQDNGDSVVLVPPSGVKITATNGKPVRYEECQVYSSEGKSAWLARQVAEELLETLKTSNPQAPDDYFNMSCRYK